MKIYVGIIALLFVLLSCEGRKQSEEQRPVITVSIEPLRFFTEAIAGDKFSVTSLVPEGSSPETYDPTPQQLIALGKSLAFLRIGYIGYEQVWADKLQQNAPNVKFFDMSDGISLIHEDEDAEHDGHAHRGGVEPHIWNSVNNAEIIADNVYRALCSVDSVHQAYFAQRLDSLKQIIHRTDEKIKAYLLDRECAFLIYHPALSYFAHDYGLRQICIEKGGKEPSPAHVQELIGQCRKENVKVIFIQKEFDVRNAEMIAQELGLKVVSINPLSYHWDKEMINVAEALAR